MKVDLNTAISRPLKQHYSFIRNYIDKNLQNF